MSNRQYYDRRRLGLCPDCGVSARPFVYCAVHRAQRRAHQQMERGRDRAGYNQYQRVYLEGWRRLCR
jgi:hypothetical protein